MLNSTIIQNPDEFAVAIQEKKDVRHLLGGMVEAVKMFIVNNTTSYDQLTRFYTCIRKCRTKLEDERKKETEPYREKVNEINFKAKQILDPLDSLIELANQKAASYVQIVEAEKRKEQEEMNELASLLGDDHFLAPMQKLEVKGEAASVVIKTEKTFKLVDIEKVPTRYLMIDEAAIKRALKAGIDQIPGLEIAETTKATLRTR